MPSPDPPSASRSGKKSTAILSEEGSSASDDSDFDPEIQAAEGRSTRSSVAASKAKTTGPSKVFSKQHAVFPKSSSKSKGKSKDATVTLPPKKRPLEVISIPPLSHFVNSEARTLFASCTISRPIVYEKAFDFTTLPPGVRLFVAQLGWIKALDSFPQVNLTMVHEFYANFSEEISAEVKLKSRDPISVFVRGIDVDISPSKIRQVLSLPSTEKGIMSRVKQSISEVTLAVLAENFYSISPTEPISEGYLSSQYMSEWYKAMGFLARSLLTPSTQTSKIPFQQGALINYFCTKGNPPLPAEYYMYQAIRKAAVPHRRAIKSSLVFPALITLLCVTAGVQVWNRDVVLGPIARIDQVTIAKSSAQSNFYVEPLEHTLLKREIKKSLDRGVATIIAEVSSSVGGRIDDLTKSLTTLLGRGRRVRRTPDLVSSSGEKDKPAAPIGTAVPEISEGESSDEAISGDDGYADAEDDLDAFPTDSL